MPWEDDELNRLPPLRMEWTVPRPSAIYDLPPPRTLRGMPYGHVPVAEPVPVVVSDEQELAERAADLERFLASVGAGGAPRDPWLTDAARELSWFLDAYQVQSKSEADPLHAGVTFFSPDVQMGPHGVMTIGMHLRGLELQPMSEPSHPRSRYTLQAFAERIVTDGLRSGDPADSVYVVVDWGDWMIYAHLAGEVLTTRYFVGPLDEAPDDWEPPEGADSDAYPGPMFKRAERIVALLCDPLTCVALANGQPPNFDGLPPTLDELHELDTGDELAPGR